MIRNLSRADLTQLVMIEKSVHISPWSQDIFSACLYAGYVGWVIELDKKIIGFIIISLTVDECHILNLCVAHEFQHQGWGRQLLQQALIYAKQKNMNIAYLEVRQSNKRAILLYQQMHFQLVGHHKNYYPAEAGNEDALIFALDLRTNQFI